MALAHYDGVGGSYRGNRRPTWRHRVDSHGKSRPPLRVQAAATSEQRRPRVAFWLTAGPIFAVLAALLFLLGYQLANQGAMSSAKLGAQSIGGAAHDFTLPLFDGGTVQLSSLRGRPAMVNFWAS